MDADNFVAPAALGQWVAVVGGVLVGYFISQEDAERAFNAARGLVAPVVTIPVAYPEVTLDCAHGQGAPVNGGCWCCIAGTWDTDPKYCHDPVWAERCGNAGAGGAGSGQPAPQRSAPTSPESGLPPTFGPAPAASDPSSTSNAPVLDVDTIAARLGVSRREVYALAAIAAAVLALR